jgi:hypothetical protein
MLPSFHVRSSALATVCVLTACAAEPAPLGSPQAVGVITEVEVLERHGELAVYEYTLDDGTIVEIDERESVAVGPSAPWGDVGRLLIVGQSVQRQWWLALVKMNPGGPRMPPDCYGLDSHGTDQGHAIRFDFGLELPKAPNFDPGAGQDDGRYDDPGGGGGVARFCIDAQGEVTAYGV